MSNTEEATVDPDGSTTFQTPPANDTESSGFENNNAGDSEGGFEGGDVPPAEEQVAKGIDPAIYLLIGVAVVAFLYYFFVLRKKERAQDEFFSDLDGEKFNLKLPAEVDEYYKIKARCEAAGWEPGKSSGPPGAAADGSNANGPHRILAQALMKRAIADIPIVTYVQKESGGMSKLYAKSMCSVKQWRSYQAAESLVSAEVAEVRAEADEIEPGWSEVIWRQAMQYHAMLKKKHEMEEQAAQEKAKKMGNAGKAGPSPSAAIKSSTTGSGKVDDVKAKELAAEQAAQELIRQEEKEKQAKKAFSGGVKKGFLEGSSSGGGGKGKKKK